MIKINRAIISVSDKEGVAEFAKGLDELGIHILSTGGTAKKLKDSGVNVTEISEYTQSNEILGGRVKTLHPKIHGGILAIRDSLKGVLGEAQRSKFIRSAVQYLVESDKEKTVN